MFSNLLVYRFILVNTMLMVLVLWLAINGYVQPIFEQDSSRLSYGIAALFIIAWLGVAREVTWASSALNRNKSLGARPAIEAEANKDLAKVEWLESCSGWLVGLGLLGTVIGFKLALSGIDQSTVGNADGAQAAVASLMEGLSIAINTTLLGAALAIWNELNCRLLKTGLLIYWGDRLAANGGVGNIRGLD